MVQVFFLIIASFFIVIFIIGIIKGEKYLSYVENLDSTTYFLKDFYTVGFALNEMKIFKLRGKLEVNLKKNAKLYCDDIYYEYYANLAWAQFLSLSVMIIAFGATFCSFFDGGTGLLMGAVIVLMIMAVWNLSMSKMKEFVAARRDACVYEFPNMVSKLSLLISSGMVLREAWFLIANGKEGALYDLMKKSCEYMENGESEVSAIHKFGVLSDASEIKKFTSAIIQGIEKGNSELVETLTVQSSELWAHKRQLSLQKGEVAAGQLIIPLGITFAGIILIIVAGTMQSMSF